MKNSLLVCLILALVSCRTSSDDLSEESSARTSSSQSSVTTASFSKVTAGEDYPTDMPMPVDLNGMKVLVLKDARIPGRQKRILVEQSTNLSGGKVLVLGANKHIAIQLQSAVAGIDFPTEGSSGVNRNVLIWQLAKTLRVDVLKIYSIEKAKADIDFPTELPPSPNRSFYVVVLHSEDGLIRKPIP